MSSAFLRILPFRSLRSTIASASGSCSTRLRASSSGEMSGQASAAWSDDDAAARSWPALADMKARARTKQKRTNTRQPSRGVSDTMTSFDPEDVRDGDLVVFYAQ